MRAWLRRLFRRRDAIDPKTGRLILTDEVVEQMIGQLRAMEMAALGAAESVYQHMTSSMLVANAEQLGLTPSQAQKLSDCYAELPRDVTTNVSRPGNIKRALERIRTQLRYLTGQADA